MLVAKLSSELELIVQISPTKTEKRIVDSFKVIPIGYQLGASESIFNVYFTKEKIVPINPYSDVKDEGDTKKEYDMQKLFQVNLTQEDLSNWGTDDTSLLEIIGQKFDLTISEFINTESI